MSVLDKAATKAGDLVGKARERADNLKADIKKSGHTLHELSELADAKDVIAKVMLFASNKTLSVDDRVTKMDMMLVMLNSLPKAKPDNSEWDELYTGWRGMMQFWEVFRQQRWFFGEYKMAEIEEYVETVREKVNEKGERKTETVRGWEKRSVDPATALQMFFEQPEGEEVVGKVNLLRMDKRPGQSGFEDLGFTRDFAEDCVTSFGEIVMVQTCLLNLNYAFNEFNVPVNTLLLIQSMAQPGQFGQPLNVRTENEAPPAQ